MQRHCSGCAFTGSGSMISSTTGKLSGRRGARSFRERLAETLGASTKVTGVLVSARPGSCKSSSSCARSSRSLLDPNTRRTSKSSFCRSSVFSWRDRSSAAFRETTSSRKEESSAGIGAVFIVSNSDAGPGAKVQTFRNFFGALFQASRSYHERSFPPRKSTPSVNMASACGVSFNLVVAGSKFFGQEKVPYSKHFVNTHNPIPSQHKILIRVCRRLVNTNNAPCRGSSPSRSVTKACRPLKPLRMSHASTATNTFRLPAKLNMAFAAPAPVPPPFPPVSYRSSPRALRQANAAPKTKPPL